MMKFVGFWKLHHSSRSCLNLSQLFCVMSPDSDIAKSFLLSKTKCAYYIVHVMGISKAYSTHFCESPNHQQQEQQMNMQICFWNRTLSKAQTLYLTSRFFRWTNADNILLEVLEAIVGSPQKLMIVLSMDGPNTSSKVYENFKWDLKLRKNYLYWERITQNYWCRSCCGACSLSDWYETPWLETGKSFKGHVEAVQRFPSWKRSIHSVEHFRCFSIDVLPNMLGWGWTCCHVSSLGNCCECHKVFSTLLQIKTTKKKQFVWHFGHSRH